MTATQAPKPGPLSAAIDMLSEARDFIDRFSDVIDGDYGASEPNAAMVMVHEINTTIDHLSAPTAPVEASGSERIVPVCHEIPLSNHMKVTLEYDPDGSRTAVLWNEANEPIADGDAPVLPLKTDSEVREHIARCVELAIVRHGVGESALEGTLLDADAILALLSARPLALGGQKGDSAELVPPSGHPSYDAPIDPARAEAQDEGAAGEIKPCPFCGTEAVIDRWQRAITVGCDFNDCPSRECYSAGRLEDETAVIAAWNARAHPSPTPAADADRVRRAVEAITKAKDLDVNLLHDGYDSGPGGGNYVYADVVRTDELFPLLDQALAALQQETQK